MHAIWGEGGDPFSVETFYSDSEKVVRTISGSSLSSFGVKIVYCVCVCMCVCEYV